MGCNQSRKERTLTEEEIKKIRQFHEKTANSYPETKGKDNLSVQAFRDIFAENVTFGEKLHEFMLKVSTTDRVDVELFVDVLELLIKKPTNKKLSEAYSRYDRVTLLCMILFPHLRKSLEKENDQTNHMHSLITYSEALDFNLCVLHMLCGQPEQKINEAAARSIADRIFPTDDAKIEFWQFQMLIKEQIYLITTLINIYFKGKFLDGTVSFMMPLMPDYEKQTLIKRDQLTQLYINNNYLLNASELKLLYQAGSSNYKYASLAEALQGFSGETFLILKFEEGGNQYIIGGFNSQGWGKQTNETSSISDSYIFSLSPQYKHLFPVVTANEQYGQKIQYCSLSMPNSYSRDSGIVFGSSKEEARLWIDSFSLQNCFVKSSDRYFKKGSLLPQSAQKPVCTYIEAYGIATDVSKKNFSQSIIGQNRLTSMASFRGDLRSSATTDITRPSLYKSANIRNGQPYSTASSVVVQQTINPNYVPYSEDVVKRAAAPSNYPQYTQASSTSYAPNSSYSYVPSTSVKPSGSSDNTTAFQPSKSYTPQSYSYEYKPTSNLPDYLAKSYTVTTSPTNPGLNQVSSSYVVNQKPAINIEDLIGKDNFQKLQDSNANAPRSTLPTYTYSNSRSASPNNQFDYQGRNTTAATLQSYQIPGSDKKFIKNVQLNWNSEMNLQRSSRVPQNIEELEQPEGIDQ